MNKYCVNCQSKQLHSVSQWLKTWTICWSWGADTGLILAWGEGSSQTVQWTTPAWRLCSQTVGKKEDFTEHQEPGTWNLLCYLLFYYPVYVCLCVCLFTTNRCVDQWRCLGRKSFIISWHFTRLFTTIILIIIMSIFRVIDSWSNGPGGFTVIWSLSNRRLCLFCQRSVAVDTSETTSWCGVFYGTRCSFFFFCSGQSQCETQWSPYMNMIHSLKWQERAETGAERESSVRVKGFTALTFKHVL